MEAATAADTEADMPASVAAAAVGAADTPISPADTFRGGHFHHGFRRVGFWGGGLYAYNGYGCWRWYPGIYGYVRVWVC